MLLRLSLIAVICLGLATAGPAVPSEKWSEEPHAGWMIPAKTSVKEQGVACDTCLQVVQLVYDHVADNRTEAFVRHVFESVCNILPGENRTERCKRFLDKNIDEFFRILEESLDPETFCFTIGLCRDKFSRVRDEIAKLDNDISKPGSRHEKGAITDLKTLQEILTTMEIVHQFDDEPTLNCMLCDTVVDAAVQTKSVTKSDYMAYETSLDFCDLMKGDLRSRCSDFVYMYLDFILDALDEDKKNRHDICPSLGACYLPETMYDDDMYQYGGETVAKRSVDDDVTFEKYLAKPKKLFHGVIEDVDLETESSCVVCDWLVNEVDKWITEKKTEDEIKEKLQLACNYAPKGIYRDECQSLIDQYTEEVIDMLVKEGLQPNDVCQKIGFCETAMYRIVETMTKEDSASKEMYDDERKNPEFCDFCKAMVKELDELLEANKDKIKSFLDGLCNRLPEPYANQCQTEVDQNFDGIIELLEMTILSPDTMCATIGVCDANQDTRRPKNKV